MLGTLVFNLAWDKKKRPQIHGRSNQGASTILMDYSHDGLDPTS